MAYSFPRGANGNFWNAGASNLNLPLHVAKINLNTTDVGSPMMTPLTQAITEPEYWFWIFHKLCNADCMCPNPFSILLLWVVFWMGWYCEMRHSFHPVSGAKSKLPAQIKRLELILATFAHSHGPMCANHCRRRCRCNSSRDSAAQMEAARNFYLYEPNLLPSIKIHILWLGLRLKQRSRLSSWN